MNLRNLYASCWTCRLGLNWNWNIAPLWRSDSGSLQDELLKSSLASHHFDLSTVQLWLNLLISFKSNSLLLSIYQLSPVLFFTPLTPSFHSTRYPPPQTLYSLLCSFIISPLYFHLRLPTLPLPRPPPLLLCPATSSRLWRPWRRQALGWASACPFLTPTWLDKRPWPHLRWVSDKPHPSITLSLMWVLCGPSLVWGLDLSVRSICDTVCLSPPALLCFYVWPSLQGH